MQYLMIIIIIIIFVIMFLSLSRKQKDDLIPTEKHINNIIDNSNYFERLNKLDFIARNVKDKESYRQMYKNSIKNINPNELKSLHDLINTLNNKYLYKYAKLYRIPWYIVKFEDVELNYPHTLGDIIFLPQKFFENLNMKTLLHEKIHIFQRKYPIETSKLISKLGFKPYDTQQSISNLRSNPDTDSFIYSNNDNVQAQLYKSDEPKDISDSAIKIIKGETHWNFDVSYQRDHPYEIMACMITDYILKDKSDFILQFIS